MNGKEVWRRIRNYKIWNGKKCIKRKGKVAGRPIELILEGHKVVFTDEKSEKFPWCYVKKNV
jgi:hypothetical protein